MSNSENRAQAKARLLTVALRAAAEAKISAQAQALLATIIAEAWVDGSRWTARLGMELLADRFSCSRHTVQRWTHELERTQLVRRRVGTNGKITRWTLPKSFENRCAGATVGLHERNGSVAPAHHNPLRQRTTDSDPRCNSGLAVARSTPSIDDEPKTENRASPPTRNALPTLGRITVDLARRGSRRSLELIREHAKRGDPVALRALEELEPSAVGSP